MKNLSLLFVIILTISSCDQDNIVTEIEEFNAEATSLAKKGGKVRKVDVCHKGKIINVSVNSLSGHLGHGDGVDMDGDGYFDIENGCSETDYDDTIPFDQSTLVDNDGDGFFPIENPFSDVDCDDANANVNASAEEILDNGIDDDCDPLTVDSSDDIDNDGDGETENEGDCDDANANVNTSAEEICGNGIDDNCDGNVDEDCIITCDVACASVDEFCDYLSQKTIMCQFRDGERSITLLFTDGVRFELFLNPENESCFNYILQYINENNVPSCGH